MNQRQTLFVADYITNGNAKQAALAAGYSEKTAGQIGSRLLRNVEVSAAIDEARAVIAERALVTAEDITRGLLEIAQGGTSESARVRAWELLGKQIGSFPKERAEVENVGPITVRLGFDPGLPLPEDADQ